MKTKYCMVSVDLERMWDDYDPAGVVGWMDMGNGHIRYKTDFVFEKYRGKKLYSNLWKLRDYYTFIDKPNKISAYCTEMSLSKYLKEGFEVQSVGKNGITYVIKTLYENVQEMES
jgi:hypothetical protein